MQSSTHTSRRMFRRLLLALLLPGLVHAQGAPRQTDGQDYVFGVFPYLSAVRLEHIYAPASRRLSRDLGRPVHFRTATQFKRFFAKLKQQRFDFALIQPFWVVPAIDQFGYLPVARMSEPFTSLVMVLDDSPLRSVEDLKGQIIATPPPFVPVVHMAKKALRDRGLEPGRDLTLKAFKSVDSCFQQVAIGAAAACVSPPFAPPVVEEKMGIRLRALLTTPAIPNLTLVVHKRVPEGDRDTLRRSLLGWHHEADGLSLLKNIKTRAFVPASEADFAAVRVLVEETQHP